MSEAIQGQMVEARKWAQEQFAAVSLGDVRLERRAVTLGERMALSPAASLPQQMEGHSSLMAAYRFLDNAQVRHETLEAPHWRQTRAQAAEQARVLLVQDITILDYSRYGDTMVGLGPVGDGRGKGLMLHSTLAVLPGTRQVMGLMHQQVFERKPHHGAKPRSRPKAERESRVWRESVEAIGAPGAQSQWVVVADSETDHTDFLLACRAQGLHFNVRLWRENRLMIQGEERVNLFESVRRWDAQVSKSITLAARRGQKAREARVQVSFGQVTLPVPRSEARLTVWIVHAWEEDAPAGVEKVEWFLASSLAVESGSEALERLEWYTTRWVVEDYHQCLKTGCAIEHRDLEQAARIKRLLGLLAVVAVRLLQLRDKARQQPDSPASTIADPLEVAILAAKVGAPVAEMTAVTFWRGVARLGGFLGRRRDGDPGWKTLWRGWQQLQLLVEGARLSATLSNGATCV